MSYDNNDTQSYTIQGAGPSWILDLGICHTFLSSRPGFGGGIKKVVTSRALGQPQSQWMVTMSLKVFPVHDPT